jgi:DNA ligase-1
MTFETLYSKSKTGKSQVWKIEVIENRIQVSYGYVDGKQVLHEKEITEGKNIGKKNETTPHQQAMLEAKATWTKKKESGYNETIDEAQVPTLASSSTITTHKTISPMLAMDYHKQGKKILFPCSVQAKLDGIRSIFYKGALHSRQGKPITGMDHILAELDVATQAGLILDGEIYSTKLSFQDFVGLVRKKKFKVEDFPKLKQIDMWVYDCVNDQPFEDRLQTLEAFFAVHSFQYIKLLPTQECMRKEDIQKYHDIYVAEGNEGLIIRNNKGLYQMGTRSNDLQKYKEFMDDEFQVIGFTTGEGIEHGLVIWECITKEGRKFHVRPKGTHEARAELFKSATNYIGVFLTVKYQELTEDGIPRFPVGIAFRTYE